MNAKLVLGSLLLMGTPLIYSMESVMEWEQEQGAVIHVQNRSDLDIYIVIPGSAPFQFTSPTGAIGYEALRGGGEIQRTPSYVPAETYIIRPHSTDTLQLKAQPGTPFRTITKRGIYNARLENNMNLVIREDGRVVE